MLYGKYRFICRLESEASLPFYRGSTFRGVFGVSLPLSFCRSRYFFSSAGVTDLGRFFAMSRMSSGVMETLFPEDFASLKADSAALSVRSSMSAPVALAPACPCHGRVG